MAHVKENPMSEEKDIKLREIIKDLHVKFGLAQER